MGVEPTTFYLQGKCSTTKLYRRCYKQGWMFSQILTQTVSLFLILIIYSLDQIGADIEALYIF